MITRTRSYLGILLALGLVLLLPAAALAQSAWQWQMSLKIDTPGNAMYMPSAVAFDPESERYYAVDTGRSRLVSFTRDGELLRAFTANDQLKSPFDMVRLDNGQLLVVEKGRNSITRIDIGARVVKPNILRDRDRKVFPDRIAYAGGKLYVLDRAVGGVLQLSDDLKVEQRFVCTECIGGFADFAVAEGSLWGLDTRGKTITHFSSDGAIGQTIKLEGQVDFPVSLAVGPTGVIYVLDRHKNNIAAYGQDGRFRYSFLGPGHARNQLHFPRQIRFDPWGRLCVVDEGNGRVEIFGR